MQNDDICRGIYIGDIYRGCIFQGDTVILLLAASCILLSSLTFPSLDALHEIVSVHPLLLQ